ncbi:MAG TPA: FAD-dependent oxidoreductase [Verrucomicrobiae bacterium]|jgi:glycine cleavage system aminomethyltransferase T/glycine/D-amino acid oxidase-like deaminating enzyme|nr:FAD-dependent oxidoreductase [Verrucomicrobiae bacterium]
MSSVPTNARVVIIGAGIVGNSMAFHLARLGWRDIVLVEKGMLPNPGGSTGHASNFIFLTDHGKEMAAFTMDSARQYRELGVYDETGGIEVARTPERMEELKRRMASSTAWGVEGSRLLTPAEVKAMVPFIDESVILGGFYTPGVGIVDSLQAGTLMRQKAQEMGALTIAASVEVTGIDVEEGRVRRVHTDAGTIEAEVVVIACGVWSPRIARMAGASIPLTPAVHQMIDIGPVPMFEHTTKEVGFPIVRDMDTNMYERQHGTGFEIGSYAHRAILMEADDIPSIATAALSPTMLPFTKEDFDPQLEDSLELFPEIVGDESVGVKLAINGLLSLTPDGNPIIGETPEVKGLWSVAAVWIKEAPGIAKTVAEWMTNGEPEIDPHGSDIARFYDHHRTAQHIAARTTEGYNKTYGIVHPMEQWESNRPIRLSPAYDRHVELGAVFFEAAGWERPFWYGTNETLLGEYGDRVMPRTAEWESRWWSPIINAEHLAMRDRAGLVDLSAFAIFDVTGPGALAALERLCVNKVDVAPGRTVYTPLLNPAGGILADLTIMRLAHDRFRVVTGGGMGMRDRKIFEDGLPADGSAQLHDVTNSFTTYGLWGPRARDILGAAVDGHADISHAGFPFLSTKTVEIDGVRALASRISYVGELGWEIYVPIEQGLRVWDALWEAGKPHGMVPVGIGTYAVTARLEKGYRAHGAELELDFDLVEAGMARPTVKDADFVGKEAYLRRRSEPPAAILCTLTLDDPTSSSGVRRYMLGREPILTTDARRIVDAKGRGSYVTSAGSGPSLGKHLLMSYLPPEHAVVGTKLLVEYFGERYPVTVAVAGATPLFDPENARIRS